MQNPFIKDIRAKEKTGALPLIKAASALKLQWKREARRFKC
jgi:hypothetical protein